MNQRSSWVESEITQAVPLLRAQSPVPEIELTANLPPGNEVKRRVPVIPISERLAIPEARLTRIFGHWSRGTLILATFTLLLIVGMADFLSGYEISFLIFYLLPVSLAAWFVGRSFAVAISMLSAAVWLVSDLASGDRFSSLIVPAWNVAIALGFFLVVTWLLSSLRAVLSELEIRVCQRTLALTEEMAERERLEKDVLEISERVQRRIGHDLHDGLGQHLTGTALAGQVLAERLAMRSLSEADDAERIVTLVEDAIELTRSLARGLSPVAMDAEGLTVALTELAAQTTAQFYLPCTFQAATPVYLPNPTATHLYRIAQEAVGNAIRHGRPNRVAIALEEAPTDCLTLTVRDDGAGLAPDAARRAGGLGLRIMAHRSRMIGAALTVLPGANGGTVVQCRFHKPPSTASTGYDYSTAS